ncbi:MAG: AAA family ATPase, partial [Acetivibrio sp.]
MKISYLRIKNFKSIRDLEIHDVDSALILVGKNNTGKTVVIDAIRLVCGNYDLKTVHFGEDEKSIVIEMCVTFEEEDLFLFHSKGLVSNYKKYDLWEKDFHAKLPSFQDGKITFKCTITPEGVTKYSDGIKKNNPYIKSILPKIYHIDQQRNLDAIQNDVFRFYDKSMFDDLKDNICMFDNAKKCNRCFNCIGVINKKQPEELSVYETTRLLEYKMFHTNINVFSEKLNRYFHANGS